MQRHHAALVALLCASSVSQAVVDATAADLSRGRQILLDRGLQIQALAFRASGPLNLDRWRSSNFTTLNAWDHGTMPILSEMPAGTAWGRMDQDNWWEIPDDPNYLKNLVSLEYWDEHSLTADFTDAAATKFASWRALYPHTLGYTNQYAGQVSSAALQSFMQAAQPDMIMFDNYPDYSFPAGARNTWYSTMQMYRTLGLAGNDGSGQHPIPYAQYLNLYRNSYSDPIPSESYVRLQQNASWAFGYTFVGAFVYNNRDLGATGIIPAMFSGPGDSSPTPAFGYVAETNRQSRNLGPALVRLLSTDVRMIPARTQQWVWDFPPFFGHYKSVDAALPTGITAWAPHNASTGGFADYITSITPYTNSVPSGGTASATYNDVLVCYSKPLLANNPGCTFADGLHFMIVNGAATGTAADSAQWYHLTFDFAGSAFDELVRLSRATGQVEAVSLTPLGGTQYYLDLNLPGGTGDLFTFWNSHDPLPTVPEPGTVVLLVTGLASLLAYAWQQRRGYCRGSGKACQESSTFPAAPLAL